METGKLESLSLQEKSKDICNETGEDHVCSCQESSKNEQKEENPLPKQNLEAESSKEAKQPKKKKFVGKKKVTTVSSVSTSENSLVQKKVFRGGIGNNIPEEILENAELNKAISILPSNYNFEIHKTLWRIKQKGSKRVGLQMPEGLLVYSCIISDILEKFANVETVIMGDVTYGACCVDDFTASALQCDLLVHYGHSCLVPIDLCKLNVLYVFVDIKLDLDHFIETLKFNFPPQTKLILVSTIQFAASLHVAKSSLSSVFPSLIIPQEKPLSPGEILGCTSPKINIEGYDTLIYLGDGRFHLESIMISNPNLAAYRYDPYSKIFSREYYDYQEMLSIRKKAIDEACNAKKFGIILGTLGRQGNTRILDHLKLLIEKQNKEYIVLLLSEILQNKLALFSDVDVWIQIACPRLSIDWGYAFTKPLLNSYEAEVLLKGTEWKSQYPMDYYSKEGGPWTNYYKDPEIIKT